MHWVIERYLRAGTRDEGQGTSREEGERSMEQEGESTELRAEASQE
jgi:hypothetical protein